MAARLNALSPEAFSNWTEAILRFDILVEWYEWESW